MSRKVAFVYFIGIGVISFMISVVDLHWMAKSALIPWCFWIGFHYFFLEGRKSVIKPFLQRFYRRVAANEMYNIKSSWHENVEIRVRG